MKKKEDVKGNFRQLWDTTWVPIGTYELHECCDCGKLHEVKVRWNPDERRLEECWVAIEGTKKAKRAKR